MAESALDLTKSIVNGLRPDSRLSSGTETMLLYDMMKPMPWGAQTYPGVTVPISSGELTDKSITIGHPYPQLFRGKGITLLCTSTKVYEVDESTWTLTQHTTYDTDENALGITGDSTWQFADFHDTWFLFNGTSLVWKSKWIDSAKTFVQTAQTIKSGCNFRGTLLMGGFDASDFWNSGWQTLWASWLSKFTESGYSLTGPGTNWIWWSSPGGGDIISKFVSSYATTGLSNITGGHTTDDPIALDQMLMNSSGFMPMSFQGAVQAMVPLGEYIVIYGTDGVDAVRHFNSPFSTFGLVESIMPTGIASRASVGGDNNTHVVVDTEGYVWSIDANLKATRLGYQEFFSGMLGGDITVSLDRSEGDYYISDSSDCYVLNNSGMGKCDQLAWSLTHTEGNLIGIAEDATNPNNMVLATQEFNLGIGGFKDITFIELLGEGVSSLQVALDFRNDNSSAFVTTPYVNGSPDGSYYLGVGGHEFRLRIKGTLSGDGRVEKVIVRYNTADNRTVRGSRYPFNVGSR